MAWRHAWGDQRAAQHHGLGRLLVERACEIAQDVGYARINVISAIGTREYYRHLGFMTTDSICKRSSR